MKTTDKITYPNIFGLEVLGCFRGVTEAKLGLLKSLTCHFTRGTSRSLICSYSCFHRHITSVLLL